MRLSWIEFKKCNQRHACKSCPYGYKEPSCEQDECLDVCFADYITYVVRGENGGKEKT